MGIDIIGSIKVRKKYKTISRLLSENLFENKDIGPINDIASVNEFIISIPKCATSSLQRGFESIGHSVIHAHNNSTTYEAFVNGDLLRRAGIDLEALVGFRQSQSKHSIHFFVGYREPVSWYLSLAGHFGIPLTEELNRQIDSNLDHAYPWSKYKFSSTQNVVEKASGIHLFSKSFNHQSGYVVLNRLNVTVVLYNSID